MQFPVTVKIDVAQLASPAGLVGIVRFVGEDGNTLVQFDPQQMQAGHSLSISGLSAEFQLSADLSAEKTQASGQGAPSGQGTAAAAGGKVMPKR